jgi:uncharacterized membrane protein
MKAAKYVIGALLVAVLSHIAFIHATPRVLMGVALDRISAAGANIWHMGDRVTPLSRTIVRPSPDFAYSACAYDLSRGPLSVRVAPWHAYWSVSLYAANSDNYFVIDDREARNGAEIVLVRHRRDAPDDAARPVESPTTRGIALIRRLAPTSDEYNRARGVARADVCGPLAPTS